MGRPFSQKPVPRSDKARAEIEKRYSFWIDRVPKDVAGAQVAWEMHRKRLTMKYDLNFTYQQIADFTGTSKGYIATIFNESHWSDRSTEAPVAKYLREVSDLRALANPKPTKYVICPHCSYQFDLNP